MPAATGQQIGQSAVPAEPRVNLETGGNEARRIEQNAETRVVRGRSVRIVSVTAARTAGLKEGDLPLEGASIVRKY